MFSLTLNKDSLDQSYEVELIYSDDHLTLKMIPEYPEKIKMVDLDQGGLDFGPSNGTFHLSWTQTRIDLEAAKYGDGRVGSLGVQIKATPDVLRSLRECLDQWKAALN